jgi:ATP-dependent RNA helicase TDRD9
MSLSICFLLIEFLCSDVFTKAAPGQRKVILATNMAESSVTIADVEFVIDFCLTKIQEADPETNYVALRLQWADRSSCEQRKGRAGRVK